ncbi:cytochrome c oxidase assembly protein [Paremcibacter congregatus]|uniref:Cytochrome c oxidase assembly protein CtaG n=1 Tax=Paremcibacter congregatus TaxID=2043170 RepID=A0A2G4YTF4_9PROT|nr:cytochrome c oxidase assembly protein [Paremcibacter congregatus]PHZ85618.1 cytochrome c oxidase assembly protein [Paremcibacter congregatus]QDE26578.1 cytochrome c oxidase assembly protein [Paremcibacter congregatus]|tara:strand:- start:4081 stop:4629 length:549 start_codon:yes stop_codon:yes gene_type:complete
MNTAVSPNTNHTKTLVYIFIMLGVMIGLVVASVPLYRLFCQVTGYGGTTQKAESSTGTVLAREMTVRFNADVNQHMPWYFKPVQTSVTVKVGEEALIFYKAVNNSNKTITGTATFNVTPFKAAMYFNKIDCFCFTEQTLAPGEEVDMPVTFFVDPDIVNDKRLEEVTEITLSYTFFEADEDE